MFLTRYGLFKYLVMPFGLTNALVVFQYMMNDICRKYLNQFMVAYLDDILIYSPDLTSHEQHVRLVLSSLREHDLFVKYEKCAFDQPSVKILVTSSPPSVSPWIIGKKPQSKNPTRVREVQSFRGFANFYCPFIKGFFSIV